MNEKEELQQQTVKNGPSKEEETASDRETRIFAETPVGKAAAHPANVSMTHCCCSHWLNT